ncbi:carbohydrate ABC transporter membrane protein 1 (CUT1 family) [Nonomuraea polychroma]|uniref:Carbohydrate ABC transporter membrane protein 1 (CUT1 family) n=1 Tax=Nonomuraea polychroma TaxID=46176 RepID=A0A438M2U7_9ACTN|nr:sugar ABC transporter permease [Nonomuraea polychroma]RVX39808.1 carbohydrate ABC transporter membrane protein 1 (CUT1 family) [Nonomuraea polychroma]
MSVMTVPPSRRASARRDRAGYLFVAPFLIMFVAMLVAPLAYAGYLSLFREQLIGGVRFAGLDNYIQALSDERLLDGVLRVSRFFLVQVPIMLVLALLFALALDSGAMLLSRVIRLGIFVPYAVPGVIAALMWSYLYGPQFGPITQLAEALGLPAPNLLSSDLMLGSVANIVTWEFTGYNMIILYAALRAIPTELYEAAAVDGAGAWRIAWSVKIPALRPALLMALIFSVIGSFQLFNEPALLQRLAPNVIDSAYTPNLYTYSLAFVSQDINYAAAVSFLLGLVIVVVSYTVQLAVARRRR